MKHCYPRKSRRWFGLLPACTLAVWAVAVTLAAAQTPVTIEGLRTPPAEKAPSDTKAQADNAPASSSGPAVDPAVKQAQRCGSSILNSGGGGGCSSCGSGGCVPGREPCSWCDYDTVFGRCIGALYDCICCPDPCYEPHWIAEANAAFFQDGARPVTQTRIRFMSAEDISFPDTAEFYWAKIGARGPANFETRLDTNGLYLYQEVAVKNFSFFTEVPYIQVDSAVNEGKSGFGDINLGTKSLLLDCELIQLAFQFRTFIPSAPTGNGLGTGHVSLEPSLLASIKLDTCTYLQTQLAEWIPLGGDPNGAGAALEYHMSVNTDLWRPNPNVSVIATFEFNGVSFQDGTYTVANGVVRKANGDAYLQTGPGIRFGLCNKVDIGVGTGFGLTDHGPAQEYVVDFRLRF